VKRVLVVVGVAACSRHTPPPAELVANPLGDWRSSPEEANARSLWDLQAYEGRLYLGYGDAVVNTGPTDVLAFDPATGEVAHEVTLPEEAISRYRVLDGQLVVPGVDAHDSADGYVYVRTAGQWRQRVIPQAVHVLDVAQRGDQLCVAVQDRTEAAAVRCSRDDGTTWDLRRASGLRATALFDLGSDLVVVTPGRLARVTDRGTVRLPLALPGIADLSQVDLRHATRCGDAVVTLATRIMYVMNTAVVEPLGAFVLKPGAIASKIAVRGTPTDVFASGDGCYLLTSRDHYVATIYRERGDRWEQVVEATVDAAPLSAERLGDDFYIGLGCGRDACNANAGHLVRIRRPRS
jgi:hypothetical protein